MLAARARLERGGTTPAALVEEALAAVERFAACNALAHLAAESARAEASRLEKQHEARGALWGIPLTVKDLYAVAGMPTRGGTRAPLPPLGEEATAVTRLRRAGAIVLAKTNLHEIAAGVSGENPWTGDVHNPHDLARQAGGSSSGSAVAVATGMGLASLGSDTGGSIRVPAAFCGVVGWKPSYGAIPLDGALPLCWSCDHAGPLAASVDDAHRLHEVLADRGVALRPADTAAPARLGIPRHHLDGWLGPAVRRAFEALLARLREGGVALVDVEAPLMEQALTSYGPLRAAESAFVHRVALEREPEGFSPALRGQLLEGRALPAQAYLAAQALRAELRAQLDAALRGLDAWLLPTAPLPAPLLGSERVALERGETEHRTAFVRLTLPFSLAGLPALSLPFAEVEGLPLGVQLVGARDADARVLEIGRWLEAKLASMR